MTIVVLLVLAGIWAAVLGPPLLRFLLERGHTDSIVDFHQTLRVLQRTRPEAQIGGGLRATGAVAAPRPRPAVAAQAPPPKAAPRPVHQAGPGEARARPPVRRASAARRRRDVMFTLLMAVGTTFVLAMVLSTTGLWILHLVVDGLLFGYVGLLVRMRNIAAEREMKLRFLPSSPTPQPQPAFVLRRSAN